VSLAWDCAILLGSALQGKNWQEPRWANFRKHVPPPRVSWMQLVSDSKNQVAFYHPAHSSPTERESLEIKCVKEGVCFCERPNMRYYYLKLGFIVGASDGGETEYICAEYHISGAVHGRPITPGELRRRGVHL
jgi:hypothetical protein